MLNSNPHSTRELPTPEQSIFDSDQTSPSTLWNQSIWPVRPLGASETATSPRQRESFGDRLVDSISNDTSGTRMPNFRSINHAQAQSMIESAKMSSFGLGSSIQSNASLPDLLTGDQPLVIAAIIVAASHVHQLDTGTLAQEFRLMISEALFLKGKRNIHILQSLLIFLLHHVHYMNSEGPSVVMIQNICISQIIDLEIDKITVPEGISKDAENDGQDRTKERAEYQSLLVCYYLCCGLAFKCQTTRLGLPLADRVHQCVGAFLKDNTLDLSEGLLLTAQLCGYVEDIQETFRNPASPTASHHIFDETFTALHLRRLERRLDLWQESVSHHGINHCELQYLTQRGAKANSHLVSVTIAGRFARVLLYACALQPRCLIPNNSAICSSASGMRLTIQSHCLTAIKTLLDGVISLSEASLPHMNFVDWIWTLSTFTALGRLSHPSLASPDLDVGLLDIPGKFDRYTEAICTRVGSSPSYASGKHGKWNFPLWLRKKCEATKQDSMHRSSEHIRPSFARQDTGRTQQSTTQHTTPSENAESIPAQDVPEASHLDLGEQGEMFKLDPFDWATNDFPWDSLVSNM